jgi:hypothetical protein
LKAIQAANQIRDQDHGGRLKIQMIGMQIAVQLRSFA